MDSGGLGLMRQMVPVFSPDILAGLRQRCQVNDERVRRERAAAEAAITPEERVAQEQRQTARYLAAVGFHRIYRLPDPTQLRQRAALDAYCAQAESHGLTIVGPKQSGKTFALAYVAARTEEAVRGDWYDAVYVQTAYLCDLMRTMDPARRADSISRYLSSPLLLLDGVGRVLSFPPAVVTRFELFVDTRFGGRRSTIVTGPASFFERDQDHLSGMLWRWRTRNETVDLEEVGPAQPTLSEREDERDPFEQTTYYP